MLLSTGVTSYTGTCAPTAGRNPHSARIVVAAILIVHLLSCACMARVHWNFQLKFYRRANHMPARALVSTAACQIEGCPSARRDGMIKNEILRARNRGSHPCTERKGGPTAGSRPNGALRHAHHLDIRGEHVQRRHHGERHLRCLAHPAPRWRGSG